MPNIPRQFLIGLLPDHLITLILRGRHYKMYGCNVILMFYFPDEFRPVTFDMSWCTSDYLESVAKWWWYEIWFDSQAADARDLFFADPEARRIVIKRYLNKAGIDENSEDGRRLYRLFH